MKRTKQKVLRSNGLFSMAFGTNFLWCLRYHDDEHQLCISVPVSISLFHLIYLIMSSDIRIISISTYIVVVLLVFIFSPITIILKPSDIRLFSCQQTHANAYTHDNDTKNKHTKNKHSR